MYPGSCNPVILFLQRELLLQEGVRVYLPGVEDDCVVPVADGLDQPVCWAVRACSAEEACFAVRAYSAEVAGWPERVYSAEADDFAERAGLFAAGAAGGFEPEPDYYPEPEPVCVAVPVVEAIW